MINMSDHLLGSWGWRAGSRQILGEACLCPQSQTVLLDSHPHPTMNEEGKAPPPSLSLSHTGNSEETA